MNLNTPNTIIYLFLNLFRIYTLSKLVTIFLEKNKKIFYKVLQALSYLLFFIFNILSALLWNWPSISILVIDILCMFIITLTYCGKFKYRLLVTVLSIPLAVLCKNIGYFLCTLSGINHLIIIGATSSYLLHYMIIIFLSKYIKVKQSITIPKSEWFSIFIIPSLTLIVSALVLDKCTEEIAVAIGEVCLVSINILIFFLLDKLQSAYKTKLDTQLLAKQNEAYDNQMLLINESEERLASLKHDLTNHFFSLKKLAEESDAAPLTNYIDKLISDTENVHTFAESGNFVVDSFLNLKLSKAKSLGADTKTDIAISTGIKIDDKDISIILGNLLDNAITALEKCEKEKLLNIYMRETSGKLVIKIENSHSEKIKKKGSSFASTKSSKSNHGIGLKNVKNVTESYDGTLDISYTDDRFIVKVLLYI